MDKYILAFYLSLDKWQILLFPHPCTDPNIFGHTQTFFEDFRDIKSIFRLSKDFHTFFMQKRFYKKNCLPTDPKKFGHVTGNKAYFSFGQNTK